MLTWILGNTLMTLFVMALVIGLCRLNRRRPALCHFLWLLAFVSLVSPPIPIHSAPGAWVRSELASWLEPESATKQAEMVAALPPASPIVATPVESSPVADSAHEGEFVPAEASVLGAIFEALRDLPWLAIGWFAGALVLVGYSLRRILSFHRRVRRSPEGPDSLHEQVQQVAMRMGVPAPPIRLIDGIGSPAIWCFGPPELLWPSHNGEPVHRTGEPALVAHELAHIARKDHWVSRLEVLAIGLCWWNPLFWVIRYQIRYYAELSCDAWALWAYPTRRRVFAEALIDAQERTFDAPVALQGLCATNSEFKNFERRLNMIMSKNVSRQVSKGAAAAALLTTLLVLPGFSGGDEIANVKKDSVICLDGLVEAKELSSAAQEKFFAKEYGEALALYEKVLELDSQDAKAHANMGYMLVGLGELDSARKHFEQQLELGHRTETAYYNLACVASLRGELEIASQMLDRAVCRGFTNTELMASDPDIEGLRSLADYEKTLKKARKSEALREKLEKYADELSFEDRVKLHGYLAGIATEDGKLQDESGLLLLKAGDYTAGLQAFERQAAVGYEVARANYNMACAYALTGRSDAALDSLGRAVDLGMSYADVFEDEDLASLRDSERFHVLAEQLKAPRVFKDELARAVDSGDLDKASAALTELMNNPEASQKHRAWASYKLGSLQLKKAPKKSLEHFEHAVALGYSVPDAAFHMAQAYAALGELQMAESYFNKSVVLGYADPVALEKALYATGLSESDQAAAMLKRATKQAKAKEEDYAKKRKAAAKAEEKAWNKAAKESAKAAEKAEKTKVSKAGDL